MRIKDKKDANKTTDPVCAMLVSKETPFISTYNANEYYFCSEKCKELFEQEPELFVSMMEKRQDSFDRERLKSLRHLADEVTHEIRNPLTSIGGFARRVYKSLPEKSSERQYMKRVIDDVEKLEKMISRLVQIETEDFDMQPTDINEIIKDVINSFERDFNESGISLDLDLKEAPLFPIDRGKMKTALSNLLRNAIEAMEHEPKNLTINTDVEGEYLILSITDTGKGIPEEKVKYIFDPFFTSKIYGPGLGLAFVKKVIGAHGGEIEVKSTLGKGTTFHIKLPVKRKG